MGKTIDPAIISALQADNVEPIYFLELLIDVVSSPEITVRLHSGLGTINTGTSDDPTVRAFEGAGSLLALSSVKETNKLNPTAFSAQLSGIDAEITNLIFDPAVNWYRRPCNLYLSALSDGALVADPQLLNAYYIQDLDAEFAGPNGDVVQLTAESEMILFKRSRNVRFSDRQLQSEFTGDVGLEFLEFVATSTVVWRGRRNRLGGEGGAGVGSQVASAVGRSGNGGIGAF